MVRACSTLPPTPVLPVELPYKWPGGIQSLEVHLPWCAWPRLVHGQARSTSLGCSWGVSTDFPRTHLDSLDLGGAIDRSRGGAAVLLGWNPSSPPPLVDTSNHDVVPVSVTPRSIHRPPLVPRLSLCSMASVPPEKKKYDVRPDLQGQ